MIAQPAEGPLHRGALHRECVIQGLDIRRRFGKASAEETFHDDHRNAFFPGQFKTPGPGLVVDVHEVVLDLDHVPVIVIEDRLKLLIRAVEGEALVADFARFFHVVKELRRADGLEVFPFFLIDAVHEIEIDVVGLELAELLGKKRFHGCPVMHRFTGHLGRNGYPVAVTVPEGFAQHDLGCFAQIDIRGVKIRHAAVNRPADEGNRFLLVNHTVPGCRAVKAHAAQTECR